MTLKEEGVEGMASFDGDGDRLVFHYVDKDRGGEWNLLDGDAILCLISWFIKRELKILLGGGEEGDSSKLTFGIIQTGYANGSSTQWINTNVLPISNSVKFTPTGVAHLHREACKYDIGCYFEANGHGTVLFSSGPRGYGGMIRRWGKRVRASTPGGGGKLRARRILAWRRLAILPVILSQSVGDALGDMLLPLVILGSSKMGGGEDDRYGSERASECTSKRMNERK